MLQLGVDLLKNAAGTQLQCNIEVKLDFLDAAIEYQLISRYLVVTAIFSPPSVSRDRESRHFFWRDFTRPRDQDIRLVIED